MVHLVNSLYFKCLFWVFFLLLLKIMSDDYLVVVGHMGGSHESIWYSIETCVSF